MQTWIAAVQVYWIWCLCNATRILPVASPTDNDLENVQVRKMLESLQREILHKYDGVREISMFFELLEAFKSTLILLVSLKQKNSLTSFSLKKFGIIDATSRDWKDFLLLQRHLLKKGSAPDTLLCMLHQILYEDFPSIQLHKGIMDSRYSRCIQYIPCISVTWGKCDDHPQSFVRKLPMSGWHIWCFMMPKICQASLPSWESQPLHPEKQPSLLCWRKPPFQHTSLSGTRMGIPWKSGDSWSFQPKYGSQLTCNNLKKKMKRTYVFFRGTLSDFTVYRCWKYSLII